MEIFHSGLSSQDSEIEALRRQRTDRVREVVDLAKETYGRFRNGQEDVVIFFNGDFADKKGQRILFSDGSIVPYMERGGLGEKLWRILEHHESGEVMNLEISKEPEGTTPVIREFYADVKRKRQLWRGNSYDRLDQTPTDMFYHVLTRTNNEVTFLTVETYLDLFDPGAQMSVSWILRRVKTGALDTASSQV